jgi:hypothetical protein
MALERKNERESEKKRKLKNKQKNSIYGISLRYDTNISLNYNENQPNTWEAVTIKGTALQKYLKGSKRQTFLTTANWLLTTLYYRL